jgi:hypothetical protein
MPDRPNTLRADPQRDEAAGYRPISATAVAALLFSSATALAVILTLVMAWLVRKRPLLVPTLLVVSVVSLTLSIVAYWQVHRSEGTRTGLRPSRIALWLSILCLGGYGGYYFAIDTVVRQQAKQAADDFFAQLEQGKPELAFRLTRDPAQRRTIEPDAQKIRNRFGASEFHGFAQSDLARMYRTWGESGKVRLEYTGPGERLDEIDGFTLQLTYVVRTPEGRFEVDAWIRGVDDRTTAGRDWQILFPKTAVRMRHLTHLGRMTAELQMECLRRFLPQRWLPRLSLEKPAEVAAIVRVNGVVPPQVQREKIVDELRAPSAIDLAPGFGPMRSPQFPTLYVDPNGVRLVQLVQVTAPAASPQCPAFLTIAIDGAELVREIQKLSGPDWEREPLLPNTEYATQLAEFKYEFKVTELNIRPELPAIAPPLQGAQ